MRSSQTTVNIILILIVIATGYYYRDSIVRATEIIREYIDPTLPCEKPITYSIGHVDPGFGMSTTTFALAIAEAEAIWEDAAGRNLFDYVQKDGSVVIDLVYDYRQKATNELARVDQVIQSDKTKYDSTKSSYATLMREYAARKTSIEMLASSHASRTTAYESQVAYWNARGGAPRSEYSKLENERQALNAEVNEINNAKASFNSLVETINSTATTLNQLAQKLNLNVSTYNTIGSSTGEEFSEGEYIVNSEGTSIVIYQYENMPKLVRVLAHELGHALGLDHVDQEGAIMYRLNQGTSRVASTGDRAALDTLCSLKK